MGIRIWVGTDRSQCIPKEHGIYRLHCGCDTLAFLHKERDVMADFISFSDSSFTLRIPVSSYLADFLALNRTAEQAAT
jgi:hypothetical protein